MTTTVVTFHREDGAKVGDPVLLRTLVLPFIEQELQLDVKDKDIQVSPLLVPAEPAEAAEPLLQNLTPSFGYVMLVVKEAEAVVYRHPHLLAEVMAPGLRAQLDALEGEKPVGFKLLGPGVMGRVTPRLLGATDIKPFEGGDRPRVKLRPISEPPPPSLRTAYFDSRPVPQLCEESGEEETTRFVKVVLHEALYRDLLERRELSPELEEGGLLVGRVFQDGSEPGCFITQVTDAIAAEHTGATLLQLTFTGDSFGAVKRRLEQEHQGQRLLGWYHTHPFPARPRLGLSSLDIQLHFTSFRIPWQLAGLINLDPRVDPKGRVLRFYVRHDSRMKRCRLEITDAGG